jgi:hypothetical protein
MFVPPLSKVGMLVYWASNRDNLLLEDSVCTVHGRFIVCGGPTENVADPEWEIFILHVFSVRISELY